MASSASKFSFCWSFWCCFWIVCYKRPRKSIDSKAIMKNLMASWSKGYVSFEILSSTLCWMQMSWDWRKILEVLILGQFVIKRVRISIDSSSFTNKFFLNCIKNLISYVNLSNSIIHCFFFWDKCLLEWTNPEIVMISHGKHLAVQSHCMWEVIYVTISFTYLPIPWAILT